jgi:uncharacterized protein YgiM (DUF1202 family)
MLQCSPTSVLVLVALMLVTCAGQVSSPAPASQETAVTRNLSASSIASQTLTANVALAVPAVAAAQAPATFATATPTADSPSTATPIASASPSPTPTLAPTAAAPALPPTATLIPEGPAVVVQANANLRGGPGTAYPIVGAARPGQRLLVLGQAGGWWQVRLDERTAWIWGALVTPNAAAEQAPEVKDIPPLIEVKAKAEVKTEIGATSTSASASTLASASVLPDLIVLGPETQYPVRARVIRGWDYELVDASSAYDIVVYRDVFGMLAHQIDDENVQRYRRKSRFAQYGPLRITLVDAQPHPDPNCPGWGWAPDRDTFVDPYGMTQNPCRVEHSLLPQGDGAGTTLQIGWGYIAGTTVAVGAAGPHLADVSTTFLAETLPWPATLGPADRPDFSQALYRQLGAARREDGRWVWQDAFAQIVPAGH